MDNAIERIGNGAGITGPQAGTIARQEFGGQELAVQAETASVAVAAKAKATVEARFTMALHRPRDIDQARVRLLKECKRPGFADAAIYSKPIGGKAIEGPSIRFVEAAIRCMTNVDQETTAVYDDSSKRIVRVSVTDLEANVTYSKDVNVEKVVERKTLKEGQEAISSRRNSYGSLVYLVAATDDDMLNKENALVSKALRTQGLRVIPGDLVDEAMAICRATLENKVAGDPDAEKRKLVDAFAAVGIQPVDLKDYLGHDLGTIVPAELVELRKVYAGLKEGDSTWAQVVEAKRGKPATEAPPAKAAPPPPAAATTETPPASQEAEADALAQAIRAAPDAKALRDLNPKIAATPEPSKTVLLAAYNTRSAELQRKA